MASDAAVAKAAQLGSIRTEILIALIFSILVLVAWVVGFLFYLGLTLVAAVNTSGVTAALILLIISVIFLVPLILSVLIFRRVNKMYHAAVSGDIATLKKLNSVGWAIIALIFNGIISGILLLVANSSINSL